MSIFCTQCGQSNRDSSNFCSRCGARLENPLGIDAPKSEALEASSSEPASSRITREVLKLTGVEGWLRFLVIKLIILFPLVQLSSLGSLSANLAMIGRTLGGVNALMDVATFFTIAQVGYSVIVGYLLAKKHTDAPSIASWYFIVAPIIFIVQGAMMVSIDNLPEPLVNALERDLFSGAPIVVFTSIAWYAYLLRSKRVLYTYPQPSTHIRCPDCRNLVFSKSASCPHCKTKLIPQ